MLRAAVGAAAVLLGACTSASVVTRGGGASLQAALSEPALGGRYRVAVGAIIDKSDAAGKDSLQGQLDALNRGRAGAEQVTPEAILHGVQDMLVTDLFVQDRFVVLERDALDDAITEQEFAEEGRVGDATRVPPAQLEGAELIVLGAITGFDAGISGGAVPIPIPLGDRGDFGVMHVRYKRGYIAMDLRVVDARTGRVLSSVAVNGRNTRLGVDFNVHLVRSNHHVKLPRVLTYFQDTPVEKALQELVTAAVDHVAERVAPAAPVVANESAAPLN